MEYSGAWGKLIHENKPEVEKKSRDNVPLMSQKYAFSYEKEAFPFPPL
jgi:hypothetical protein